MGRVRGDQVGIGNDELEGWERLKDWGEERFGRKGRESGGMRR